MDAALSFGWIDGVRRSIDAVSYSIRLTPRKRHSTWSAINVRRVGALIRAGLMHPAGLQAFRARSAKRTGIYSYEQRPRQLPSKYAKEMRENATAWAFFRARPPWYQRTATWWVVSAKKEETRLRRLAALIAQSAKGRTIGPLTPKAKSH